MNQLMNLSWTGILITLALMLLLTFGAPKFLSQFESLKELLDGVLFSDINCSGVSIVAFICLGGYIIVPIVSLFTLNLSLFLSFVVAVSLWVLVLSIYAWCEGISTKIQSFQ